MISEGQDLLSSIRTVRALLDQEFGGDLVAKTRRHATAAESSTATAAATATVSTITGLDNPNINDHNKHWKNKFYHLKKAHYDEKQQMEANLEQQRKEILRLETRLDLFQQEAETERQMRTTLETTTLEAHRNHIQTLTQQLDKVQTERNHLEEHLQDFLRVVKESQDALSNERTTWEELLQQTRQEKDRISKCFGEEEAGRLRAQAQVKELQKAIKLQQIRMEATQNHLEKTQKQHTIEVAMTKKVLQQKINHLQEQMKEIQSKTSKASADSDAAVKKLQLQLKEVEAQNTALKNNLDETKKEAEEEAKTYNKLQQQYEQCEAARAKVSHELVMVKAELEKTKQNIQTSSAVSTTTAQTAAGSTPSATVLTTTDQVKRANLIYQFEMIIAKEFKLRDSLLSQIEGMTKAQAQSSQMIKEEELAEKKNSLNEKREALIKKLESIEKLLNQQLKALRHYMEETARKLEASRTEWHAYEEQLTGKGNVDDNTDNQKELLLLQEKADTSANNFSVTRQQWQAIKKELSELSSKQSKYRGRLAALRNLDDNVSINIVEDDVVGRSINVGDTVDTKTTTTITTEAKSTSSTISETNATTPTKKRANQPTSANEQVKRLKKKTEAP
jgi:DNA repair exonuclease SbcCD ATPase subunit